MPPTRSLSVLVIVLFALVASLHVIGMRNHLYWLYPWFDVVLHFLGGLWVGLTVIWLAAVRAARSGARPAAGSVAAGALMATLAVGLAWELWEYLTGMVFVAAGGYAADTAVDLALDLLGGAAATLTLVRLRALPPNRLSAAPRPDPDPGS